MSLIVRSFNDTDIRQLSTDGYVDATEMCQANGKKFYDYSRLKSTQKYLEALSRSAGIPVDLLIRQVTVGENEERGTWVHPKVAIHLGQWCSPQFAVFVTDLVFAWMNGNAAPATESALDDDECDATQLLFVLHLKYQELTKQQIAVLHVLHFARGWVPYTRLAVASQLGNATTLKAMRSLDKAGLIQTRSRGTIARVAPENLIPTKQTKLRGFGG